MDLHLRDKIVLITGGSRGIGRCTALQFAAEGAKVAICGRDQASLAKTAAELRDRGGAVAAIAGDVCVTDDAQRIVDQTVRELGGLDILINNVGADFGGALHEAAEADWTKTFEHCIFHAIRMTRLAAPHLARRGGGSVVNIASISGVHPALGSWQYGSAKAALIFATERLALELAADKTRVNVVSPGSILWPDGSWDNFRKTHQESFDQYVRDGFPMGRLGKPEEVADVIVFTASPRANWINGRNIGVDGCEQPVAVREFRGW